MYLQRPNRNLLATRHHPSFFPLAIRFASGLSPKQLLVHLGGYGCQASPGRGGGFLCLDVRLVACLGFAPLGVCRFFGVVVWKLGDVRRLY